MKSLYTHQISHVIKLALCLFQREIKSIVFAVLIPGLLMLTAPPSHAQSGLCDAGVPFFTVDLSSSPSATWTSPNTVRSDNCCGTSNPDRCIEFEITLHPSAIAINFDIASGAVPPGALFYQINCGPQIQVGQPVCIIGPGPHTLTFCKPGNNANTYTVTSIPNPSASPDQHATPSCPANIWVDGLLPGSIAWTDITGGGAYLSYLSCTTCPNPTVTPVPGFPPYVDYRVCGTPAGSYCLTEVQYCDTVRVYFYDDLTASINPNPAGYCISDGGVLLTGSHTGGVAPYTYAWFNQANGAGVQVGNGLTYFASSPGTYSFIVYDSLYPNCGPAMHNVNVQVYPDPVITIDPANASICEGAPLTITASGASTYLWSTGATTQSININPTSTTAYSVTGTNEFGCTGSSQMTVHIYPAPDVEAGPGGEICLGESFQLNGSGADFYEWTPTATLNDPNIANPIATPAVTTTYYLTGYLIGGNIMFNGNFNHGNIGFTTDYNYNTNLYPEGNYFITTNPNLHHANFAACGDHTTGTGNMMLVNGSPIANQRVWCQTVAVTPGITYIFSTWLASVHPANPAVLQFSINGTLLGTPFTATNVVCNWNQFYELWDSGINTTAEICIVNQNVIHNGNDFAIDDIYFAPLCPAIDSVTVVVHPNPIVSINPINPEICQGESTSLTATSDIPGSTFLWSNGATTQTITVSPASTTVYSVTATSPEDCTGSAQMTVIVHPNPVVVINSSALEICDQASATLTGSSDIAGTTWQWSTGQNTNPITVAPNTTTTYTLTGTSPEGCTGTAQVQIVVHPLPNITANTASPEICAGESADLLASSDIAGTTWQWNTGQNTNPITVSPVTTTTYTVTGTSPEGCTGTAQVTVIVHPNPVVNINSSALEICDQASATLTGSSNIAGTTWQWSTGQNTNPITVAPNTTTTYTLTGTSPEGCIGTAQVQIVVHPLPNITANTASPEICVGESADLLASSDIAGTTWLWNTGQNTNPITVSPVTTTTYTVTGTSPEGCTGTAQLTVIVHPNPVVNINSSALEICDQASATLTGSSNIAGTTWQWSTGQNTNPITVAPNTTTTYTLTGTSPEGCTGTAQVQIVVHPLPNITANSSSPEICVGESADLLASSDIAGTTWLWNTGQNTNPITVSPVTTTTYTVTGTSPEGCTGTAQVQIVVHPLPNITANTASPEICVGESADLMASSDIAGTTWLWNTGQNTNPITVSPVTTTTYTVTGTSPEGCTGTAQVTVIVHPNPVVDIISNTTQICDGAAAQLTVTGPFGTTFLWNTGQTDVSIVVTPNTTTTYSVTGTSTEGCTGTAQVQIVVHPLPNITANTASPEICVGESADLLASSDIAGTTWQWNTGQNINPITVSPVTTTTYTVTGTSPEGCTGTAQVTVIVHPNPVVDISSSALEICDQASATLTGSSDISGTTWQWSTGQNTNPITVAPNTTTTYTLTGTSPEGCTGTAQVQIVVHPLPNITANTASPEICAGESADLLASSDIAGTTWLWNTGQNTNPITVSPVTTTTYTVTGTSPEGCTGTTQVTVIVHPNPVVDINSSALEICDQASATLTGSSNIAGTTWQWSTGQNTNPITVAPNTTTTYTLTGTSPEGCTGTAQVQIVVHPLPNITANTASPEICVGESADLLASSDIAGTTWQWNTGQNTNPITVSPVTTTTYTVTGTSPEGCTGTAQVTVIVHPNPVVDISSSALEICDQASATLTGSSNIAGTTWQWSTGQNTNPITVAPNTTTTYTLTGTSPEGCTGTAQVQIVVHPLPNITANTASPEICVGESADLLASSDIAGTTWQWNTGQNTNPITVSPVTTTTYTVTGTSPEGCTGTAQVTVIVHPNPVVDINSSALEICDQASATLTGSSNIAGTTWQWSTGQNTNPITVAPNTTTTYTLTGTSPEGCTGTAQIQIVVHPLPNITANTASPEICVGESADLLASSDIAGTTWQWNTSQNINPITVSPVTTTTYTVTGTSPEGCTGTAQVTVIVHPNPVVDINSSALEICDQASATLTGSSNIAGTTWQWSTGQNTNPITVAPNTTTTYTLTGTSPEGCTGTAQIQIVVHPLPNITANTASPEICVGESADLMASSDIAGTTWQWNTGQNTNPITVSPVTTTTYTVTGTSPEGCTGTAQVTVIVHPNPVVDISSSALEICDQASATLTGSSDIAGTTWQWSTGQNTNPITVAPNTTTTYTLTGTSPEGCTGTAQIQIVVHPLPNITANTASPEICVGESADLLASSDIAGTTWQWNTGQNINPITVSPVTTTTYTVTGTSPEGCTGTAQITVIVHPNPVVNINSSALEICDQASATLTGSSNIAGTTWQWSTGQNTNPITVAPNTTTTYTLTGTSPEGCTGTAQVQIVVHPLPNLTISQSDHEICEGEDVTFTITSDLPGTTWQWNSGQTNPMIVVSPIVSTTYYVTGTSSQGCTATAQVSVTVHPNPFVQASAASGSICLGSNTSITATSNIIHTTWMWSTGDTDPTTIVQPTQATTYTVTGTTNNGCSGTSSVLVEVLSIPDVDITVDESDICFGKYTNIHVTTSDPLATYQWSNGATTSSTFVQPFSNTIYTVTVTDSNGCSATGETEIIVLPNPLVSITPPDPTVCLGESVTLTAHSNHQNTNYQWNNGLTSQSITVTPSQTTTYIVTGTDANGCSNSSRVIVTVLPIPNIQATPLNSMICPGEQLTLNAHTNMGGTMFIWSTGATSSSITVSPTSSTSYTVTGTAPNGCSSTAQANVNIRPAPVITVTPINPAICEGESITLTASGGIQYMWTPAVDFDLPNGSQVTISPTTSIQYVITGIDDYGCIGEATVMITVHAPPIPDFSTDKTQICAASIVYFNSLSTPANEIASYIWNFGDPSSGNNNSSSNMNPAHVYTSPGNYWVSLEVTSIYGCKASIMKPDFITVYPNPIASYARTPDITDITSPKIHFFNQALGELTFLYDFGDPYAGADNYSTDEHPTHSYTEVGEYWTWQFVTNEWGCIDSTKHRVIIKPAWQLYIPNAFTPNGDGHNDYFFPSGFNVDVDNYDMYIYTRWGEEIFSTNDINRGWDGSVKGSSTIAKPDVYVYLINIRDIYGHEHQFVGNVTLIK